MRETQMPPKLDPSVGFSLVEVMVSITLLLLGVITAAGVMVTTEQGALFTEERYQGAAELRNAIEREKAYLSLQYFLSGDNTKEDELERNKKYLLDKDVTSGGAGLPNLSRIAFQIEHNGTVLEIVTYRRIQEERWQDREDSDNSGSGSSGSGSSGSGSSGESDDSEDDWWDDGDWWND